MTYPYLEPPASHCLGPPFATKTTETHWGMNYNKSLSITNKTTCIQATQWQSQKQAVAKLTAPHSIWLDKMSWQQVLRDLTSNV